MNDVFRPHGMNFNKLVEFSVYNRWGERIFTTSSKEVGWDGTYLGIPQDAGVYFYLVTVVLDNGNNRFYKGDVTLIR